MFGMFIDSNWTSIVQFFVGIRSLLNTHDELFNVSETAIQQCL